MRVINGITTIVQKFFARREKDENRRKLKNSINSSNFLQIYDKLAIRSDSIDLIIY